jgi:CRP-like cAMP-binding protein
MEKTKLRRIALFEDLSDEQLRRLAGVTDEVVVPAGTRLIDEGAFAYEFLLILDGQAEVRRGGELIATLGPGEFAGEIGAMRDARRNATVTAASELTALVMTARDLRRVAAEIPSVGAQLDAAIAERDPAAS